MKKLNLITIVTLFIATFPFLSCDNEPIDGAIDLGDFNNGGNNTPALFKADFNGSTWTANTTQAQIIDNTIQIVGIKTDGSTFAILVDDDAIGTYQANENLIAYNPSSSTFGYASLNFDNPAEDTGSIIITSIDTVNKKISGTFSFKGYWTNFTETGVQPINFTNGVFTNISYTTGSNPNPNPTDDTFFAKVNGVDFVENTIDVAEVIASGFPDSYSIVASKTNGENIGLRIAQSLPVGTHNFDGPFNENLASTCIFGDNLYTSVTGTLTITTKTATRLAGTFQLSVNNFTTNNTKQITNGTFDVELP